MEILIIVQVQVVMTLYRKRLKKNGRIVTTVMEEDISLISAHPVMEEEDSQKDIQRLKQEPVVPALEQELPLVINVEIMAI